MRVFKLKYSTWYSPELLFVIHAAPYYTSGYKSSDMLLSAQELEFSFPNSNATLTDREWEECLAVTRDPKAID